ncbi:HypC/HybG/HupF family hydrogenase formation chaperone [Alteromonas mediterranea]|uniref:HypC/HybG/HupF family hydrogenase formation chaperone n=1 Tax=Alteromonas mediterranea TaxID=314275 RepID=UPI002FE35751
MCLAVPMQVKALNNFNAVCEAKGVSRDVSLQLLQQEEVKVGNYVMVHVGYALQVISYEEAMIRWKLLDQVMSYSA